MGEMTAEQVKSYCDRYRHVVRQDEDAATLIRKVWRDAQDAALSSDERHEESRHRNSDIGDESSTCANESSGKEILSNSSVSAPRPEGTSRHRKATPAENLEALLALRGEHLSAAERRELQEAIDALRVTPSAIGAIRQEEVRTVVHALRTGICDDPCKMKNAGSGCDCAIAADLIEKLACSSVARSVAVPEDLWSAVRSVLNCYLDLPTDRPPGPPTTLVRQIDGFNAARSAIGTIHSEGKS